MYELYHRFAQRGSVFGNYMNFFLILLGRLSNFVVCPYIAEAPDVHNHRRLLLLYINTQARNPAPVLPFCSVMPGPAPS